MDKIGIAGAGGIGSNVAVNLVRSGITNLKIILRVSNSKFGRRHTKLLAKSFCKM